MVGKSGSGAQLRRNIKNFHVGTLRHDFGNGYVHFTWDVVLGLEAPYTATPLLYTLTDRQASETKVELGPLEYKGRFLNVAGSGFGIGGGVVGQHHTDATGRRSCDVGVVPRRSSRRQATNTCSKTGARHPR